MLRDVTDGPRGRLLDRRVKLLQARHERVERARVDDRLREVRRVLRDRAEHEGRGLLHKAVLLRERVHELRQDLVADDRLGEVLGVVGEAPERERGRLLDTGDVVQKERAQQLHHARILQGLDVLRAGRELGDRLHEVDARLLVVFKDGEDSAHDCEGEPTRNRR